MIRFWLVPAGFRAVVCEAVEQPFVKPASDEVLVRGISRYARQMTGMPGGRSLPGLALAGSALVRLAAAPFSHA